MTEEIAATQVNRISQLTRGLSDSALREMINAYWRFCLSESHAIRVTDEILRSWTSDRYAPTPADIRGIAEATMQSADKPQCPRGCKRCDYCGTRQSWYLCTKGDCGEPDTRVPMTEEQAQKFRAEHYTVLRISVGIQGVYQLSDYCDCDLGRYLVVQAEKRRLAAQEEPIAKPRRSKLEHVR